MQVISNEFSGSFRGESYVTRELSTNLVEDRTSRICSRRSTGLFHVELSALRFIPLFHVEQIIFPKREIWHWVITGLHFRFGKID
jgi:hypothetical protein